MGSSGVSKIIPVCCVKYGTDWRARSCPLDMFWWIQTKAGRFPFCMFVDCTDHQAFLGVYWRIMHISCTFLSGTGSVWILTGHASLCTRQLRRCSYPGICAIFHTLSEKALVLMYWNACLYAGVPTDLNQIKTKRINLKDNVTCSQYISACEGCCRVWQQHV